MATLTTQESKSILSVFRSIATLTLEIVTAVFGAKTWRSHETGGDSEATWADYETGGPSPTTWASLET